MWWWLALGAVLIGAGLRVWQWQLGTTLFMDELAIIHNLVVRTPGQLVHTPLLEAQVAPPLFLLVEQACLRGLGSSEQVLRLPALLASLLALPLLWAVAGRVLSARLVPLLLLAFGVGFTFLYYSNQVKPYASDVAISILVVWLALRLRETSLPSRKFLLAAALAGLVLPFYSQSSLLVFGGCGAMLVLLAWFDAGRPRLAATLAVVGTWAVGCGAGVLLAHHNVRPIDQAYMQYFWADGLLPLNAHLPAALLGDLTERLGVGLGWPHPAVIWVAAAALGLGLLWWRQRPVALLLLAPWLTSILASLLQQFPLRMRLMDFLLPTLLLFVFAGLQGIVAWGWRRSRPVGWALLALCAVPVAYSTTHHNLPPYATEDAKPLFAWLAQHRRPTDAVYSHYGANQYLRWYGPRYQLAPYQLGQCFGAAPGAKRGFLRELDTYRGRRVWVVLMHFHPDEEQAITSYLDSIGRPGMSHTVHWRMPDELVGFPTSTVRLYDLTDARRAAHYSAATFPLLPSRPGTAADVEWSCYGPQAMVTAP